MTNVNELGSSGVIYVRHQQDPEAEVRPFGPRGPAGETPENICLACREHFVEGDYSVLVPLGPGQDLEARGKAAEGRWYNAVAVEIHQKCATG